MLFVLDASVTITWVMHGENHPLADLAFNELRLGSAIVPVIWWYELRNVLVLNERRGRISPADCAQFLLELDGLRIRIVPPGDGAATLELARTYGLTVYDAAYMELAQREHLPLATLDKALQTAARSAGIALLA
jgi:predicted nucleic acid-binding protein